MAEPLTPEDWERVERAIWPEGPAHGHGSGEYAGLKARALATVDRERLRADAATARVERLEGALREFVAVADDVLPIAVRLPTPGERRRLRRAIEDASAALQDIPAPEPRT